MPGSSTLESAFWLCALGGSIFFVMKTLMMVIAGMDHGLDMDTDAPDIAHEGFEGSDAAFKVLSLHSITAFLMMFGWIGLASLKEFEFGEGLSFGVATVAGLATMFLTAWVFKSAMLLVSSGTKFNIESTVGQKASVYQRIPSSGVGKIQIAIDGVTRELEAESETKDEIESFKSVEVVRVINHRTVSVKAVD